MLKKIVAVLLSVSVSLMFGSCWNYRGLNQITIVSGVAIDKNENDTGYHLSCEVVDLLTNPKQSGIKAKLIECDGDTIFDAFRNAKRRVINKLYIGHADVIVISEEIARVEGVKSIIDLFYRDAECRETMTVAVSREKTAKRMLSIYGIDKSIVSKEIKQIIENDNKYSASTRNLELYQIYNYFHGEGKEITLPSVHVIQNDEEPVVEAGGVAVFKSDLLVGYLDAFETKYLLYANDEVKGGLLIINKVKNEEDNVALEVHETKTDRSFEYKDGKIKVLLKIDTQVFLGEHINYVDSLDKEKITELEKRAEQLLIKEIGALVKKVQTEFNSDIFNFGNMIYKKDPKLWKKLEPNWDNEFRNIEVVVQPKVKIINTAFLKNN